MIICCRTQVSERTKDVFSNRQIIKLPIETTDEDFEKLFQLGFFNNVKELDLSACIHLNRPFNKNPSVFSMVCSLTALTKLSFAGPVQAEETGSLRQLSNLKSLHVLNKDADPALIIDALSNARHLTDLELTPYIYEGDAQKIVTHHPDLTRLKVKSLRDRDKPVFRVLCQLTQLTELHYWAYPLQENALDPIRQLTRLQSLTLATAPHNNRCLHLQQINLIRQAPALQYLDVSEIHFQSVDILSALLAMTNLKTLHGPRPLSTWLTHTFQPDLKKLSGLLKLETLDFHHCFLAVDSLLQLMQKAPKLKSLGVSSVSPYKESEKLARVTSAFEPLQQVHLHFMLSDSDNVHIAQWLRLCPATLTSLKISSESVNPFYDNHKMPGAVIPIISRFKHLKNLEIDVPLQITSDAHYAYLKKKDTRHGLAWTRHMNPASDLKNTLRSLKALQSLSLNIYSLFVSAEILRKLYPFQTLLEKKILVNHQQLELSDYSPLP